MSVNKVILVGHLGKDPEVRVIGEGIKVAKCTLATSESYTDKSGQKIENTEWHNITFWRGLADIAEKYLKKGKQIYVEGKLRTTKYEKGGETKYFTEIQVDSLQMLGKKEDDGSSSSNASMAPPAPFPATEFANGAASDDLPF